MESKRKNIYIVVFVITTIIASCVALYFVIMKNNELADMQAKLEEVQKKLDEQSTEVKTETEKEVVVEENKEEKNENVQSNENKDSNEINSPKINLRPILDYSNSLNVNRDESSEIIRYEQSYGFASAVIRNTNTVVISYNPKELASKYQLDSISETNASKTIIFSNQKVVDVFIEGFGQAIGYETVFFLMEDGTVEYLPLRYALKNDNFKSYGKIEGVKDVVKIENYSVHNKYGSGGFIALFGITSDGNYYEISNILSNNEYYKW